MDNVAALDSYRKDGPPIVVTRSRDNVFLFVRDGKSFSLSSEEARNLGEALIDTADLIDDESDAPEIPVH